MAGSDSFIFVWQLLNYIRHFVSVPESGDLKMLFGFIFHRLAISGWSSTGGYGWQ
jgi:hypothetical protein